ncbi:LysR family transcriptional regulator [Pontivivens ytuae]|uniref:LysR family transcriptional regulator n=1 Tax=Pontivivens ytuae TaxID=2789856 RepID=A0A7S9LTY8_9RHOB|nr:LysR family transcriptional regulator [Pontivivens ytuae]QPH54705.1 LysR family transcriptional regulator [Pontivivens ytuae]
MVPLIPLRTFLEVRRTGSISAAAARLGITQPAASTHIRLLEDQLGRPLFTRHARGVEPTPMAEDLADAVGGALDGIEARYARLRARGAGVEGIVRLIGPPEFVQHALVPALTRLAESGVDLRIALGGAEAIYAALADGQADLAITASAPDDPALGAERIAEERLLAVASPRWIAAHGAPGLADARAHPPLAYDTDLPLIRIVISAAGHPPDALPPPRATAPDLRLLRDMAEAGLGWTVLPHYLAREALRSGTLTRLAAPEPPANPLFLTWPRSALRTPRVTHARDVLRDLLAQRSDTTATL